jgi:hypothetical protein
MVALFDTVMGLGCNCCLPPDEADIPDIVCHRCKKVLLTTRERAAAAEAASSASAGSPAPELDLEPRP